MVARNRYLASATNEFVGPTSTRAASNIHVSVYVDLMLSYLARWVAYFRDIEALLPPVSTNSTRLVVGISNPHVLERLTLHGKEE